MTYPHLVELTGYQPHDDQLFAYPLMTVTIDLGGGSTYTIKNSVVLEGATQFVYAKTGEIDKQDGEATYEGCNAFYTTIRYEQWERPDGTIYEKAIGEGEPVGPADVCETKQETASYWVVSYNGGNGNSSLSASSYQQMIARTVRTNPVTGEVFTGQKSSTGTQNSSSGSCNAVSYTHLRGPRD